MKPPLNSFLIPGNGKIAGAICLITINLTGSEEYYAGKTAILKEVTHNIMAV